jgi:hypothetical protein
VIYEYDYLNRLIGRTHDPDGDLGAAEQHHTVYVYDRGQIVLQLDAADLSHRYLWGAAVDRLLADERVGPSGSSGELFWALTDHQGTVRDLAQYDQAQSDHATGTTSVVHHISYDTFGNVTGQAAAVDHLFGYTGRAYDEATGLQNNLHRWYDAPC